MGLKKTSATAFLGVTFADTIYFCAIYGSCSITEFHGFMCDAERNLRSGLMSPVGSEYND